MRRFIYFDTETTGTRAESDKIIELAAYDPLHKRSFVTLINPQIPIPPDATAIHQITDEMVRQAPSFAEVISGFLEFCAGDVALVAHNNDSFDLPFLEKEFARAEQSIPSHWFFVDSLKWARRYRKDLPRHSLQFLRQMYGIAPNQAHRALDDVMVLYQVFQMMIDDLSCDTVCELLKKSSPREKNPQAPQEKEQKNAETLLLFK